MLKFQKVYDPPEILKPYVWFFAFVEDAKVEESAFNYDVVPLGDPCIVFPIFTWSGSEGGAAGMSFLLVSGPMSRLMRLMVTPKQVLVARLRTGAFQAMFGMEAHRIKDKTIFLEKLWGKEAKEWAERLRQAPDIESRLQVFEEELVRRAPSFKKPDPYAVKAVEMMKESNGRITVEELAYRLGYTERQVHRKFEEGLGLTPKEYQRVLRSRLLILRMLNGDFKDWSDLVNDHGYFDQSHLIHEFKGFMGVSPEKFLRQLKAKGRIIESPLPGVRDETAMLGYPDDFPAGPLPKAGVTPIDIESVVQQSASFPDFSVESLGNPGRPAESGDSPEEPGE